LALGAPNGVILGSGPEDLVANEALRDEMVGSSPTMARNGMVETPLDIENAVNETCPWSGKPIAADSLTIYREAVVGFGSPDLRDRFEAAIKHFDKAIDELDTPLIAKGLF
jgi:hypothetical protein